MPKTAARPSKFRHHVHARPKHRHTKDYLKVYWPYMPLATVLIIILALLSPINLIKQRSVLAYATNVSSESLLQETNEQRTANGRDALKLNNKLSQAADAKAKDMVARNYWSHNTPENNEPWVFVSKTGYSYQKAGENLAYGFNDSSQTVSGWMNSATHRANVLDAIFSEVGFGFANSEDFVGKGPSTVIVALYARPSSQPVTATTFNDDTASTLRASSNQKSIGRIQVLTRGSAPWIGFTVGLIAGGLIMYLLVKHSWQLKKAIANSEKFVINHPLLDATLIALIVLSVMLSRQVGVIL